MRNIFLASAIALLPISAMAHVETNVQTAEYYQLDTWVGEYPSGYQILADVEVTAVKSPENPVAAGACTLKKDSVIHPWARKTSSEFLTQFPVSHYRAKMDFEVWVEDGKSIPVQAGDEVLELSYLAEGICLMSVNGQLAQDGCFGENNERAELVSSSPFQMREFFRTECKEGHTAWIEASGLIALMEHGNEAVKGAEIVDYGSVEEP